MFRLIQLNLLAESISKIDFMGFYKKKKPCKNKVLSKADALPLGDAPISSGVKVQQRGFKHSFVISNNDVKSVYMLKEIILQEFFLFFLYFVNLRSDSVLILTIY